jgi:uncharacterized membrane protein YedE/YeeE
MITGLKKRSMLWGGVVAILIAVAVTFLLNQSTPRLAVFWILGFLFGVILARSRFCFVSGFSNLFLFRDGEMFKAIIAGMMVSTLGFAFIMHGWVGDPATGAIPPGAHVAPFGWYLILAGVIFGFGMVIAGCCITGSLYRTAGGFVHAFIALTGVIIGMGAFLFTREAWWSEISKLPRLWLPAYLGWPGAVITTILILVAAYLLIVCLQNNNRSKAFINVSPRKDSSDVILAANRLSTGARKAFLGNWPVLAGGVLLGLLNILCYLLVDRPWGVTGEIQRWAHIIFDFAGFGVPEVVTVPGT